MKKIFSLFAAVLFAGSMMAANVLEIDFTQGQGDWTIENAEMGGLEFVWAQTSQYGMKATGYVDGNHATDATLISPKFDLTNAEVATLAFSHARRYGSNDQLSVLARANEGEWAALEVSAWPDGTNWNFIDATADLAAFVGMADVQVAFRYTSTDQGGATWEIKTVTVSDEGAPEPPVEDADVVFLGSDFYGQGTSGSGSPVSATKDGVTFKCDKAYCDSAYATLRCYKNGVITITSETEQIGKLVFQFYSTYTGDLETEVVVNAKEWTYTLTNQARIEKLSIYFGEYEPIEPGELVPITVAEAMAIGEAIEGSGKTDEKYSVIGYVINAKPYGDKYEGAQTFYMSDDRNAAKGEFTAFNCNVAAPGVEAGDYVIVTGRIQKYVYEGGDYVIEITGGDVVYAAEGVENVFTTVKAQKVMMNGTLYIIRGNKMFDVRGAQVR